MANRIRKRSGDAKLVRLSTEVEGRSLQLTRGREGPVAHRLASIVPTRRFAMFRNVLGFFVVKVRERVARAGLGM